MAPGEPDVALVLIQGLRDLADQECAAQERAKLASSEEGQTFHIDCAYEHRDAIAALICDAACKPVLADIVARLKGGV